MSRRRLLPVRVLQENSDTALLLLLQYSTAMPPAGCDLEVVALLKPFPIFRRSRVRLLRVRRLLFVPLPDDVSVAVSFLLYR